MKEIWILVIVCIVLCLIGCAIDYFAEGAKKTTVLVSYAIILGGAMFAAWGLDNIHNTIIKSVFLGALIFSGRWLMRKYANRKS